MKWVVIERVESDKEKELWKTERLEGEGKRWRSTSWEGKKVKGLRIWVTMKPNKFRVRIS
jgi:hypothetical protein